MTRFKVRPLDWATSANHHRPWGWRTQVGPPLTSQWWALWVHAANHYVMAGVAQFRAIVPHNELVVTRVLNSSWDAARPGSVRDSEPSSIRDRKSDYLFMGTWNYNHGIGLLNEPIILSNSVWVNFFSIFPSNFERVPLNWKKNSERELNSGMCNTGLRNSGRLLMEM